MKNLEQERLMVLKMVEDNKITADEAVKLINALREDSKSEILPEQMEEKLSKFSQAVDSFAKDFAEKFESVSKEVEPKLKKATKIVVEKTASIIDDISKSLNDTLKSLDEEKAENQEKAENEEKAENQERPEEAEDNDRPLGN